MKEGSTLAQASSKKTLHIIFVRNHFESIGKPILLKGDEVTMMIWFLKCLELATKNT